MNYPIERLHKYHWPEVKEIYEMGIETENATFATEAPSWEIWSATHDLVCRLVVLDEKGEEVLGFAAISPVSNRDVYDGVGETSIYIRGDVRGKGVGTALLSEMIRVTENEGYWMLQAGIFPENRTSIKIHEAAGFRKVGKRERIGKLNGVWRDVELYERRSEVVG
ncbi:N-acetyltransferase family protein [Salibacterium salarium]|uniref:N-acetyltransferase family protein n=1 Tax=Salibacterium salarium TaxID=284579 RepID=A0A428N008_9BACI|nr:GNAT family N-acetyltransferase [Salibacterium salarium]RSL31763.1 N-acetyltransferase family protein [Salibacterium salarium]